MKTLLFQQKIEPDKRAIKVKRAGIYPYFRAISSDQDTKVKINGKDVFMFGSNSYLGLTNHPYIKEQSKRAIDKYGTGCAGSRFLNGTLDIHVQLERKLADFLHKEDALVFSTGFQTNLGVVSALTGRHDYIILDESDHASIYAGARLSVSKILRFKHNDPESLEKVLISLPSNSVKMIVAEGIFSMDGDIVRLPEIAELCEKYACLLVLDDAHSTGVLGKGGRGTASHFNLESQTDIIVGTFSKSLASLGGFVAADKDIIEHLRHHARSFLFSASATPAAVASASAALDVLQEEPWRISKLWENTYYAIHRLTDLGFEIGQTESPIIPIYVRDDQKTFQFTKMLLEENIFVNPVVSPAVRPCDSLIRFSLMATHTKRQIDFAMSRIDALGEQLDIKLLKREPAYDRNNHN